MPRTAAVVRSTGRSLARVRRESGRLAVTRMRLMMGELGDDVAPPSALRVRDTDCCTEVWELQSIKARAERAGAPPWQENVIATG